MTPTVSPMTGTVVQVLARPGDTVRAGRPVVILESMKMEHEVLAGATGTIRQVAVAPGDTVAAGDQLLVIEDGAVSEAEVEHRGHRRPRAYSGRPGRSARPSGPGARRGPSRSRGPPAWSRASHRPRKSRRPLRPRHLRRVRRPGDRRPARPAFPRRPAAEHAGGRVHRWRGPRQRRPLRRGTRRDAW